MKFEKKNHHYVPQFWQRGFKGESGHLFGKFDSSIRHVSPKTIMKGDWLYTIFDEQWNPSDNLEDALSGMESDDALLFNRLQNPSYSPTPDDLDQLCSAIALQATRHPDILDRCHRLTKEFGSILANAHSKTHTEFKLDVEAYGISEKYADELYEQVCQKSKIILATELTELQALSPQSPQLPSQFALLAASQIKEIIKTMKLSLLDAPDDEAFVLGDTPLPQSNLAQGFSVPLSKSLAVKAIPSLNVQTTLHRRKATPDEVKVINQTQADNSRLVVIGPSAELLKTL